MTMKTQRRLAALLITIATLSLGAANATEITDHWRAHLGFLPWVESRKRGLPSLAVLLVELMGR